MQIHGSSAIINLQPEECLRIESGTGVQVDCVTGMLWITREGDLLDDFLADGQSVQLRSRGLTIITALRPSYLRVQDSPSLHSRRRWLPAWGRARKSFTTLALRS